MSILDNIKYKVGKLVLNQKLKSINRSVKVYNLYTAKSVGIIFNATNLDNYEITKSFQTSLSQRNIKVEALGFVDSKEIVDFYTARKGFSFFCKKNLNWYSKPKNPVVDEFMSHKYDILIDLSLEDHFPIRYILSLTEASFKVGRFVEGDSPYDFMLDISKNKRLDFLIDQIKYYLTLINN